MAETNTQTATAPTAAAQPAPGAATEENVSALDAALMEAFGASEEGENGDGSQVEQGSTQATRTEDGDKNLNSNPGSAEGEGSGEDDGDDSGEPKEGEGDESDPEKQETEPANGLEALPKWARKRLEKQSADIRKLREKLAPSEAHPLAHVVTVEDLAAAKRTAQSDMDFFGGLAPDDLVDDGKGGLVYEVPFGKTTRRFTPEEVDTRLRTAKAVLDPKVVAQREGFIATREQLKPWEAAEAVAPGIMKEGTPANEWMTALLERAPALRASIPDFETVLAHTWANFQNHLKTMPTEEYPKGRFKQVWVELDKEGNPVTPKRPAGNATPNGGKPKPQPAPSGGSAPQRGAAGTVTAAQALESLPDTASQEDRLTTALEAAFAGVG
jgi:hypothetical protein